MKNNYYDFLEFIKNLNLKNTVIEIGAGNGDNSIYFNKNCNFSFIYSYEISDSKYRELYSKILINNIRNIIPFNIGLSNKQEDINTNYGTHRLITLDQLYVDFDMKIDLIIIYLNNENYKVLEGSKNIIKKHRPLLMVESIDENNFNKIDILLNNFNYKTNKISYNDMYFWKPI